MSIAVTIDDLPEAILNQIGWCYLLTVTDEATPRVVAIAPEWSTGATLTAEVGRSAAKNVAARPEVTLVYPPASPNGMSLIVDGTATVDAGTLSFMPSTAVMHRPAIAGTCS